MFTCPEPQVEFNTATIAWEMIQVQINENVINFVQGLSDFDETQRYINALLLLWCMLLTRKIYVSPDRPTL